MLHQENERLKIAVIGGPALKISRSPEVHSRFGFQCGIPVEVTLMPTADVGAFYQTMKYLSRIGFVGTSIAQPYKEEAFKLCSRHPNELTERALYAKAVNAVKFTSAGKLIGDNTDGIGLVNDIEKNFKFPIKDKNILIIGAGGVAHGILLPILVANPRSIVILNRTNSRAIELVVEFKQGKYKDFPIQACLSGAENLTQQFDLVINATSSTLEDVLPANLPGSIISRQSLCYDVAFSKSVFPLTPFESWAQNNGASFANGIGMGVEQGLEAFKLWTGRFNPPDSDTAIAAFPYHRAISPRRTYTFGITPPLQQRMSGDPRLFTQDNNVLLKLLQEDLISRRHDSAAAQRAYDNRYGLLPIQQI